MKSRTHFCRLDLVGLIIVLAGPGHAVDIPAGIAGEPGSGQNRGFRVRSAQAPQGTVIPRSVQRAHQQLNGTLIDEEDRELVPDEATKGPQSRWQL